ncbi:protocadherin Fat 1 isoform X1 [Brachionus plicatilis]|uniref:Protocadherin Fat 1 isoform X1 n=1 Tax=Brachionus plicatilis TaxID=10195 RepID=A0A3M7SHT7_BRAPC|nr:protocadherin Fat 1 isoform X1 [Brachionus plicatilis]
MQTKYESTEHNVITSKPSSINTLIPTASDIVAGTTTKLIQTIPETDQPSEYLSSSSTIFQIFTTIDNHKNSPTESSSFEYFNDSLNNKNTRLSDLYFKEQSESTNKEFESTTLDKVKTTIESIFFNSSTRSSSTSQELSTFEQDKTFHSTQKVNDIQGIYTEIVHSSFDALPETNSNMVTNIQHHLKEDFSFSNLLPSELIEVLKKNYDMNDCLNNCSVNGLCKFKDKSLFVCECFSNYAGSSCQINILPCVSNPCLNNGTCVNNLANKTFICHCQSDNNGNYLYFGKNCQNKVDVCANETCSKNGVCYDVNDKAKCKCFSSYSGEKCQIESDEIVPEFSNFYPKTMRNSITKI